MECNLSTKRQRSTELSAIAGEDVASRDHFLIQDRPYTIMEKQKKMWHIELKQVG